MSIEQNNQERLTHNQELSQKEKLYYIAAGIGGGVITMISIFLIEKQEALQNIADSIQNSLGIK